MKMFRSAGNVIRSTRQAKGMSREMLAARSDCVLATVYAIENGLPPRMVTAARVCAVLGLSLAIFDLSVNQDAAPDAA